MSRRTGANNAPGLPGMQEIIELAKLLRNNGDKVLSASSKLSLSTKLLHHLNEAFSLIIDETDDLESSFQVCNSSRNDVFRDIKFLHDFVQKTIGLKIIQNPNDVKVTVDITKFRHLKYLELQKVCIDTVKGIQGIRGQLECVVCAGGHGVINIHDLLACCGGDAGAGFVWASLHRLALPYNALTHLDKSLEFTPWLESIDLSHNILEKANELEYLPSLRNVNLGFNKLDSIPLFNRKTFYSLQKLILKNNFIDNIDGLQDLECLVELDLSFNCLIDHSMLWPLEMMSMLVWVNLEGNPLAYHPRHRLHTIKHLHPSLSDSKFVLDSQPLSKPEKLFVSENRVSVMRSSMRRSNRNRNDSVSSMSSSLASTWAQTTADIMNAHKKTQNLDELENSIDVVSVGSRVPSKKKKNVKEAVIAEDEIEKPKTKASSISSSYLESSMDHLEIKRQILALREKYGEENWLSNHSGQCVQNIMGMEIPPVEVETIMSSTFKDSQQSFVGLPTTSLGSDIKSMSPIQSVSKNYSEMRDDQVNINQGECGEKTNSTTSTKQRNSEYESTDEGIVVETETENESEENQPKLNPQDILEMSYDPDEEKGDLYLVEKRKDQDETDEIFLIITPEDIKERDSLTGKIKYRWATNTVLSCVLGKGTVTTLDITFDTTRKDRVSRTYITDYADAKKIFATLHDIIKTKPMVLKIFKCMKCSTHFSQDGDNNIVSSQSAGPPKCPTCMSTLVIQTDEVQTPAREPLEKIPEKAHETFDKTHDKVKPEVQMLNESQLPHSSSQSSIGGTEGGAKPITTSLVHFVSHPQAQICCSATSLEESRESTPSTGTITRKYESDIEVLSNPSQSSIEVLDDSSKSTTPHRKKSSEERRIAVAPTLLTIPDTTLIMAGLTESSSSGSLTDSVCTAYENKIQKNQSDKTEPSNKKSTSDAETTKSTVLDSESAFAPVTNLTSMLGGLLLSMKIGPSKDSMSRSEDSSDFIGSNIQYNYTEFNNVDHRIKLHIILNVFEHENEELAFLLRAEILDQNSTVSFPGCLVISTAKVYIMKINGVEGEDPQRWLHKKSSYTIDRLRSFAPLPYKQGVLVELQQPNKPGEDPANNFILCILQDISRTSNFLRYLTEKPLPSSCEVDFMVPQYCTSSIKNVLKSSKNYKEDDSIKFLAILSSATLKTLDDTFKLNVSSLIISSSTIVILKDNMHWLLSGNSKLPSIVLEEGIINLIEVDDCGCSLVLNFVDEVAETEATWTLDFVSPSAANAVIESIRPSWEDLFSVKLDVNSTLTAESSEIEEKT